MVTPLQAGYELHQRTVRYTNDHRVDYVTAKVEVLGEHVRQLRQQIKTVPPLSRPELERQERQATRGLVDAAIRKRMFDKNEDYVDAMRGLFAADPDLKTAYARS